MFVNEPVELAKPNLKVAGTTPFTADKLGILIKVSAGVNTLSLFVSNATERLLLPGSKVIWTLFLARARVMPTPGTSMPLVTGLVLKKL